MLRLRAMWKIQAGSWENGFVIFSLFWLLLSCVSHWRGNISNIFLESFSAKYWEYYKEFRLKKSVINQPFDILCGGNLGGKDKKVLIFCYAFYGATGNVFSAKVEPWHAWVCGQKVQLVCKIKNLVQILWLLSVFGEFLRKIWENLIEGRVTLVLPAVTMAFNYYPKNWHANGMGWYNPAAMQTGWKVPPPSAPRAPDAYSTGSSSSGVSSACPYPTSGPSGMPSKTISRDFPPFFWLIHGSCFAAPHSAYGFVMPPPLPQMPGIAPPAPLYPPLNFEGSGGSGSLSSIGSMISEPNIPPVVPPTISGYGLEEIPCAAIKVPEDQFFFSVNFL